LNESGATSTRRSGNGILRSIARDVRIYELAGHEVPLSNPGKVYFPAAGVTKGELADFYVECAEATLNHLRERPTVLKRFTGGIETKPFYQKRVPDKRPPWLQTCVLSFPSGRTAEEFVPVDAAHLVWGVSLGNVDWNPHPVRRADLDHPDELRVDLDPTPGAEWARVREAALVAREVLEEHGLRGYPKTSGSRGMHIPVRIHPRWDFTTVRRAALALAREVERRIPDVATSRWWKEERPAGTVFVDYNQNAKDHTVCSAYSVRPVADARVSCPLAWEEVADCDPADYTLRTVPARLRERGDPSADIDDHAGSLDSLLELAQRDEEGGLEDAPWPPHFAKQPGEPKRVQPSRARDD
jgi:bifunctional non-homologous end joining protein LigD